MSNTKSHTPEPWKIELNEGGFCEIGSISDYLGTGVFSGGESIAFVYQSAPRFMVGRRDIAEFESNARRIVACVNALAGIETEALELVAQGSGNILAGVEKLKQENAALREALERVAYEFEPTDQWSAADFFAECQDIARTALESPDPNPSGYTYAELECKGCVEPLQRLRWRGI
jgi:hypothetical protein